MAGIEADIMRDFYKRLGEDPAVSLSVVKGLRGTLQADRLPRAEALADLFAKESGEPLA